jgi:hypothetical protein
MSISLQEKMFHEMEKSSGIPTSDSPTLDWMVVVLLLSTA